MCTVVALLLPQGFLSQVACHALDVCVACAERHNLKCKRLCKSPERAHLLTAADMPRGWAWATWVDPLAYAVQALIANEFASQRWAVPYEFADPGSTTTLGQAALDVRLAQKPCLSACGNEETRNSLT